MKKLGFAAMLLMSFSLHGAELKSIRGQLLDENGMAPMSHQDVYSDSQGTKVAVTDDMGYFDYPLKDGQKIAHVLPWSREIVGRSVLIDVSDFKDSVFRIVVERGVVLQAKIVDKNGQPIAGVPVAWVGSGGASGISNENGIANVGRISRFKTGDLVASPKGYAVVSRKDLCASTYCDRIITFVLSDYPVDEKPEKVKF